MEKAEMEESEDSPEPRIQRTKISIMMKKKEKQKRGPKTEVTTPPQKRRNLSQTEDEKSSFNEVTLIHRINRMPKDEIVLKNKLNENLTKSPHYTCFYCESSFFTAIKLKMHFLLDHKVLFCQLCDLLIENEKEKAEHDERVHSVNICEVCQIEVRSEEMDAHYSTVHDGVVCRYCDVLLLPKIYYDKHLIEKHCFLESFVAKSDWDDFVEKLGGSTFFCKLCEKSRFREKFGHFAFHHKINVYYLACCFIKNNIGMKLTLLGEDEESQKKNPKKLSPLKKDCCEVCMGLFTEDTPKTFHMVFCQGKVCCHLCEKLLKNGQVLEKHLRKFHEVSCNSCGNFKVGNFEELKRHYEEKHRLFLCDFCDEGFEDKVEHMKVYHNYEIFEYNINDEPFLNDFQNRHLFDIKNESDNETETNEQSKHSHQIKSNIGNEPELTDTNLNDIKIEELDLTNSNVENFNQSNLKVENIIQTNPNFESFNQTYPKVENINETNSEIESIIQTNVKVENFNQRKLKDEIIQTNPKIEYFNPADSKPENFIQTNSKVENFNETNSNVVNIKHTNSKVEYSNQTNIKAKNETNLIIENSDSIYNLNPAEFTGFVDQNSDCDLNKTNIDTKLNGISGSVYEDVKLKHKLENTNYENNDISKNSQSNSSVDSKQLKFEEQEEVNDESRIKNCDMSLTEDTPMLDLIHSQKDVECYDSSQPKNVCTNEFDKYSSSDDSDEPLSTIKSRAKKSKSRIERRNLKSSVFSQNSKPEGEIKPKQVESKNSTKQLCESLQVNNLKHENSEQISISHLNTKRRKCSENYEVPKFREFDLGSDKSKLNVEIKLERVEFEDKNLKHQNLESVNSKLTKAPINFSNILENPTSNKEENVALVKKRLKEESSIFGLNSLPRQLLVKTVEGLRCSLCGSKMNQTVENVRDLISHYKNLHSLSFSKILELIGKKPAITKASPAEVVSEDESIELYSEGKFDENNLKTDFSAKYVKCHFEGTIFKNPSTNFPCILCREKQVSYRTYIPHLFDVHNFLITEQFLRCTSCNVGDKSFKLENHMEHYFEMESVGRPDIFECGVCYFGVNKEDAREHILEKHADILGDFSVQECGLKCRFCSLSFWQREELEKHELEEHFEGNRKEFLECYNCHNNFCSVESFKQHNVPTETNCPIFGEIIFECTVCFFVFPSVETIREHFKETHPKLTIQFCPAKNCKKWFATKKYVKQHFYYMHNQKTPEPTSYDCEICSRLFPNRKSYLLHMKNSHTKGYKCVICGDKFLTTDLRKHHYTTVHPGEIFYECADCQKTFHSKSGLHIHSKLHHDFSSLCTYCGKEFFRRDSFKEHLLIHIGPKHQCTYCPKVFTQKSNLRRHIRLHTGEKPYNCPYCSKKFSDKGACNSHVTVHTKDQECHCEICGKKFSKQQKLKYHMKRHTGEGLFVCDICLRGFTSQYDLRKHKVTHDQQTQIICECGRGFSSEKYLRTHIKVVHNPQKPRGVVKKKTNLNCFQCLICKNIYSLRSTIIKHLRTIHKIHKKKYHKNMRQLEPEDVAHFTQTVLEEKTDPTGKIEIHATIQSKTNKELEMRMENQKSSTNNDNQDKTTEITSSSNVEVEKKPRNRKHKKPSKYLGN